MIVRPAVAADCSALLPMVRALCDLHRAWDPARYAFLPDIVERYERWLPERAADPRSVLLIASDSAPIGFIVGTVEREIPIYEVREFGFIHDTWVEPSHRGRGIGGLLTRTALEAFRAMGVAQVRLDTARANGDARRLFSACGFRESCVQMLAELA